MDTFALLDRAGEGFEQRARAITPDQWDLPTPCTDWTVRQLVAHVITGNRMAVVLLQGASRDEALRLVRTLSASSAAGQDALADLAATTAEQAAAFRQDGALERTVEHPAGPMPGARLLGFRVGDFALHGWDLARAIGADEQLDPEVVAAVWSAMQPMASFIGQTGFFGAGPSGTVGEDAPLQVRMLDLTGRRP